MLFERTTTDLEVDGNRIAGSTTTGIAVTGHRALRARDNTIDGPGRSTSATGIRVEDGGRLTCDGNVVAGVRRGVDASSQSVWTAFRSNAFDGVSTAVALERATGSVLCTGNLYSGVTTPRIGLPTDTIVSGESA